MTTHKIGLILGSTRLLSNTTGIAHYVQSQLPSSVEVELIHLATSPGHPLPLLLEGSIPAGHPTGPVQLPLSYTDPLVQQWSATVLQWQGVIILTPQYNWGIPAPLKNALDQLYHEWKGLPCAIMTLGERGGEKCEEALRIVCAGGLHMDVCEKSVGIGLPREVITSDKDRLTGEESWLREYDGAVRDTVEELLVKIDGREKKKGLVNAK